MAMMGERQETPAALFYDFCLERHVPLITRSGIDRLSTSSISARIWGPSTARWVDPRSTPS